MAWAPPTPDGVTRTRVATEGHPVARPFLFGVQGRGLDDLTKRRPRLARLSAGVGTPPTVFGWAGDAEVLGSTLRVVTPHAFESARWSARPKTTEQEEDRCGQGLSDQPWARRHRPGDREEDEGVEGSAGAAGD